MSESLSKSSPAQLLKDWDKKSKLSDGDNEIVVKLQKYCENRPILDKVLKFKYSLSNQGEIMIYSSHLMSIRETKKISDRIPTLDSLNRYI
jgi:hypothetical protein